MNLSDTYFNSMVNLVESEDPVIAQAIKDELTAQRSRLKLIASENYCSPAVQATMGSLLTDKYAEGNPGKRYYSGCEQIDMVESRAAELACQLFGAEHAYVQPASGCDANNAAYWSVINAKVVQPKFEELQKAYQSSVNKEVPKTWGDLSREEWNYIRAEVHNQRLLSLSIDCGGHLTHSSPMNTVNEIFEVYTYGVNDEGYIDYDEVEKIAMEVKPLILLAGYSAYPRNLNFAKFREIADKCGSVLMVDMAHFSGLVAGKVLTGEYNPIPYADIVTTTTHKTLRGPRGGMILCKEWLSEWVDKTCPVTSGGPMGHVMAAKAVAFGEALKPEFQDYAHQIVKNCKTLAETLMSEGIKLVTDGTDNHLLLMNVNPLGLNGRQAENALLECDIVTNRNSLPNDPNGVWYSSGIRMGTAALTTCGMKEEEMKIIGKLISKVLHNCSPVKLKNGELSKNKVKVDESVKQEVILTISELLKKFTPYKDLGELK